MSKLAKKLSRQIMAIALSVSMIMPNMAVYASEVSVPDTQEEITAENEELNVEQPLLTVDEADDTSAETVDTVDGTDAGKKPVDNDELDEEQPLLTEKEADVEEEADEGVATALYSEGGVATQADVVFEDGFQASSAEAEKAYYFDFAKTLGAEYAGNAAIDNYYKKGLFSFDAGNKSAAVYNGEKYGVEFKTNNKLTFKVAGNSYIVVGGDSNSNCEALVASSSTGTLDPETNSTKTGGHATLENCKEKGANTLVYEYTGGAGEVSLTLNLSGEQTSTKAYIAYVCIIPNAAGEDTNYVEGKEYNFAAESSSKGGQAVAVTGIETNITYHTSIHGLNAGNNSTMKLNLSGSAEITVIGCKEGVGLNGTVTPGKGKVLGKETVTNDGETAPKHTIWVPSKGKVTLTFAGGNTTYIHSIKVTYTGTEKYSVTVTDDGHGTATASPVFDAEGEEITLTAEPKDGFALKDWEVVKPETAGALTINKDETDPNVATFTLPGNDIVIKAVFEATGAPHDITVTKTVAHGSASEGSINSEKAGITVDIANVATATPDDGYELKEWKVTYQENGETKTITVTKDATSGKYEFTMPDADITIEPVFEVAKTIAAEIYDFTGSNFTTADAPVRAIDGLTVDSSIKQHDKQHGLYTTAANSTMSLNLSKAAKITVVSCTHSSGATMTASSGTVSKSEDTDPVFTVVGAQKGLLTLTFAKSSTYIHSLKVEYTDTVEYTIKLTNDGNGSATADKEIAEAGTVITLTPKADNRYKFKDWEVVSGDVTITNNKFTMPAANVEIKALFEPIIRRDWDFANDEELKGTKGKAVTGNSDTVAGLSIDATESGSGWDSTGTGTDGAVAKNKTKITVPVEGMCKIKISAETSDYTVDGKAAATAVETFDCEGKDSKVVIVMTADNHIKSINVTPAYYVKAGTYDFNNIRGLKIDGFTFDKFEDDGSGHGYLISTDATMKLNLSDKAIITVTACRYNAQTNMEMTATSGDKVEKVATSGEQTTDKVIPVFTVRNVDAGECTLTFELTNGKTKGNIHSVVVEYVKEIAPGTRNIDVWDFGAVEETDTENYNNNITAKDWIDADANTAGGVFQTGANKGKFTKDASIPFGDLTLTYVGNDRLYSAASALANKVYVAASTDGISVNDYGDGYTSNGAYYCNGNGGSGRRLVTIENVQAGDKIVAYIGLSQNGPSKFYFDGTGAASAQTDSVNNPAASYNKYEFVAEYTGTYKIWADTAGNGKPVYHRIVRIPGAEVSGTIDLGDCTATDYSVKFVNNTNNKETVAKLDGNNFSAILAPGFTYTAVFSGAIGYGFTDESKSVEVKDSQYKSGVTGVSLVVEEKDVYEYSGNITGFAEGEDLADLTITMVPPKASNKDNVKLEINKADLSFSGVLESGVEYSHKMEGVDDYEIKSALSVNKTAAYSADIEVELKPKYSVTGNFIGLGSDADLKELSFAILDSEGEKSSKYVYKATVANNGYSVELRNGEYIAVADVKDYTTQTHVVVNNGVVKKDLLFVSTVTSSTPLEWKSDIYVGYSDREDSYATVGEAMLACERMKPDSEAKRIKVHIAPGVYREQITVNAPYITFVNDTPSKQVLLTWYYGIGYKYYSVGEDGFYDPQKAYDKFSKKEVSNWGTTVYVKGTATAFRAEGITFESSFNRYITTEELEDGVECTSLPFVRTADADVEHRSAIERAAAMIVDADKSEFLNCGFYSGQDTLGTGIGTKSKRFYFKNCVIEGNTDYICGSGDCVFDGCELSWKGYSNKDANQGGYITAHRADPGTTKGYLFRNCIVTENEGYTISAGYFGRPWSVDSMTVFLNTKLAKATLITAVGWASMSGRVPEDANYHEYNTTTIAGDAVNTSSRVTGTVIATAADAAKYTVKSYLGDWTPVYYVEEAAGDVDVAFVTDPALSSNAAAGLSGSKAGNTLTVSYSLGTDNDNRDASIISWYRVDGTTETLIKVSNASDKTYLLTAEDTGKKIKVTVLPAITSGKTGSAKSVVMTDAVLEGFDDNPNDKPTVAKPNAIPESGSVEKDSYIRLTCATSGASIYYTTDGSAPSASSTLYAEPGIKVEDAIISNNKVTIKAIAVKDGMDSSPVATLEYTIDGGEQQKVAAPTAHPENNSKVAIGEFITLSCAEGAKIYYTTDGNPPTVEDKNLYGKGIEVVQDIIKDNKITIKAIAVKDGMKNSDVAEFTYTYDPDKKPQVSIPTADPAAGAVAAGTVVKLSTATKGADIYYITGTNKDTMSDPDASSTKYTEAGITINEAVVIKAIALKEGMEPSTVAAFVYTIDGGNGNKNGLEIILKKKDYTYTGSAIIPDYTVAYNGKALIPGIEYTVKCSNNVKVADEKAKITVTGKGNMSGKTEETFNIKQKSLAKTDLSGAGAIDGDKLLALEGAKATPVLIYNGKKLAANKDFEFADAAYKNKKDWTAEDNNKPVTIKAKEGGSFKDSRDLTVVFVSKEAQRNAKLVVKLDNTANKNIVYDGINEKKPTFTVENKGNTKTLVAGTDYIVSYQHDIISAGKKTFTVTGISADCVGTVTKTYTVKPAPMDDTKVKVKLNDTEVTDSTKLKFVSTGVTFAKDKLKVTYDGKNMVQGVDYNITYSANKKVGTGKYTVTGIGNYKGVKKNGSFTIEAAAMSDANVTVIVPDVALGKPKVYKSAPYVIEKDTNTLLKASNYKVTYWSDADATTPLGRSSEAGTAYVKIEGKGGYDSATSLTKSYAIKAVEGTVQDLSTAKIAFYDAAGAAKPAKSFSYTGEAVQPYSMKITFKGNATPVEVVLDKNAAGFDNALYSKFDITFVNNTNKGTASVIVKAKDESYVGGKTATFKIAARNLNGFTWGSASTSSFFGLFK